MAHTKSAMKRARQSMNNRAKNRAGRSGIKTAGDRLATAVAAKDAAAMDTALRAFHAVLDKAAKQGIIPRNTAIRRKTRANARVRVAK